MAVPRTVLIIDDDAEVRSAIQAVLQKKGYRTLCASDGNQGVALAERERPDLVIVDMMMPRKSGFLVLESLRRRPGGSPPAIMITANEGVRHQAYAEQLGVADYLRKPFDLARLLESVGRLCPLADAGTTSG